jgi:hypothetical protein
MGERDLLGRATPSGDPIPGFRSWLAALPDAELPLRGHILADLAIDAVEQVGSRLRVTIAALTLIDA